MRSALAWLVLLASACTSSPASPEVGGAARTPILDAGDEPPVAPYGPALCPPGTCNYQTNAGCGDASCTPDFLADGTSTPTCRTAGTSLFGSSCTAWTNCAKGSVCVAGVCRKLCCGKDWTGCPAGEHCLVKLDVGISADAAVWSGAYVCMPTANCDPLAAESCPAGSVCQIVDATGATDCIPWRGGATEGLAGSACPCQTGFTCVAQLCRRLCRATADGAEPSCPPAEGRCVHYLTDPPNVGECLPVQ